MTAGAASKTAREKSTASRQDAKTKLLIRRIFTAVVFLFWTFFCVIFGQIFIGVILTSILGDTLYSNLWMTVYTALSYVVACALIIYVPIKFAKTKSGKKLARSLAKPAPISPKDKSTESEEAPTPSGTLRELLGLSGWLRWRDIALAAVGFFVYLFCATLLVSLFASIFPWFDAGAPQDLGYSSLSSLGDRLLALFALAIVAPVAEEIVYRGWLYGKLRSRFGMWISILLVSVLFGFAHGAWNVGVNVFVLSVISCLMREITGGIYSSIVLHIIKNAVAIYLLIYTGAL